LRPKQPIRSRSASLAVGFSGAILVVVGTLERKAEDCRSRLRPDCQIFPIPTPYLNLRAILHWIPVFLRFASGTGPTPVLSLNWTPSSPHRQEFLSVDFWKKQKFHSSIFSHGNEEPEPDPCPQRLPSSASLRWLLGLAGRIRIAGSHSLPRVNPVAFF
jgi:hypothetical protein